MNRCESIVCIALFTSATACSTAVDDGADPRQDEPTTTSPKRPPRDAAPPEPDAPAIDAGSPGTAAFIDACLLPGMTKVTFNATGTFDAADEGVTAALDLPFPFTFYGTQHSKYWFTTNGQLGFGPTPGGSAFGQVTCPLPDARFTTPIVLVYSADLIGRYDPEAGVCYAITGAAPSRQLVVTWKDSFFYDAWLTSDVTFSAILNEGTDVIDVLIGRVDVPYQPAYETGIAAVLGRQSGGAGGAYSCFQANAPEGTAVRYAP